MVEERIQKPAGTRSILHTCRCIAKRGGRTSCRATIGHSASTVWSMGCAMIDERTTAVVQRTWTNWPRIRPPRRLSGAVGPVRPPVAPAVRRLLYRSYPRLTQPPLNLQVDESLAP